MLHAAAQGGRIVHRRDTATGKIVQIDCFNRDGWRLEDCSPGVSRKLRRRRLIFSHGGAPYRISREDWPPRAPSSTIVETEEVGFGPSPHFIRPAERNASSIVF